MSKQNRENGFLSCPHQGRKSWSSSVSDVVEKDRAKRRSSSGVVFNFADLRSRIRPSSEHLDDHGTKTKTKRCFSLNSISKNSPLPRSWKPTPFSSMFRLGLHVKTGSWGRFHGNPLRAGLRYQSVLVTVGPLCKHRVSAEKQPEDLHYFATFFFNIQARVKPGDRHCV